MSVNAFCLLVRQCGNGSVELLGCELAFVNFIGREGNKQGTMFDAVTTVKRVVGFVVAYAVLIVIQNRHFATYILFWHMNTCHHNNGFFISVGTVHLDVKIIIF
ncbi:hypothetical protein BN168_190006 [Clostridioides difficile CD002]|nr:hypothetical protein BN168_190006 [Clostridioides difficile CD002]